MGMRLFTVTLAAAAMLVAAAPAMAQRQPGNLTLNASAKLVRFGKTVTLSGKLTGRNNSARNVEVEQDPFPFENTFIRLAVVSTTAQGDWTSLAKPSVNTHYRARSGSETSRVETVEVRPAISLAVNDRTPRKGARVRFSGRLCPEHDDAALALQRRTRRGFVNVKSTTLKADPSACSIYAVRARVRRDSRFRMFFAGDADHAAGPSRGVRVDVH